MIRIAMAGVLLALAMTGTAVSGERGAGLGVGTVPFEPLRFRNIDGGSFRPTDLIIVTDTGTIGATLPETADAQSEDRMDLSGLPFVGALFGQTLSTDDARAGVLVGPVYRDGSVLIVDASGFPEGLYRAPVMLATNVPRLGAVSYRIGYLEYATGLDTPPKGEPVGSAHIVDGRLVLASMGGEAAHPSVEALFRNLFE